MMPGDVAESYDRLADRWRSDRFPRDNGIAQHERAVAFLSQKRYALDIGCGGSGRILDLLLRHGFAAEGVDISARMLELARQRHPDVTFHHADICRWDLPREYDLVSAWDSIWHVPLAQQAPVMQKVMHALNPGGVFIFTMGGLDAPSEMVNTDMGPRMYYSTLGIPHTLNLVSESGCICRHLEYDQYPESHVYIVAQRAA
jgi:SAM-dependent methyltransferase